VPYELAAPRVGCSRDIRVAVLLLLGWDLRYRFGRSRCRAEGSQASAIEYGQCSVTPFHDYDTTSGKTESSMSGVDL